MAKDSCVSKHPYKFTAPDIQYFLPGTSAIALRTEANFDGLNVLAPVLEYGENKVLAE